MIESEKIPSNSRIRDVSVVHHDASTLVVCATDADVWTWSPATGEWVRRPLTYAHAVDERMAQYPDATNSLDTVAALSVDGSLLVAAGGDEQEPALWDLATGELRWRTPSTGAYIADIVALEGMVVTAQQYSEQVKLWSPDGEHTVINEAGEVSSLAAVRAGDRVLLVAGGEEVVVWEAGTWSKLGTYYLEEHSVCAATACVVEDRTLVIVVTTEGELLSWALDEDSQVPDDSWALNDDSDELVYGPVPSGGTPQSVAVLPLGGRPVLVTPAQNSLRLWDPADGTLLGHVAVSDVTVVEAADIDGRAALVTAGYDGVVRIWGEADLT